MTDREIATVLAALRAFQEVDYQDRYDEWSLHFEDHTPLEDNEIDELCEEINTREIRRC